MIFADAFELLELGEEVGVDDGRPAPPEGSAEWKHWRSHNHVGTVAEKIPGPPRALRIELPEEEIEGGTVRRSFVVVESSTHVFVPRAAPPGLSATKRAQRQAAEERSRLARLAPHEIVAETETRMLHAFQELVPGLKVSAEAKRRLFPNARD